MSSIKTLIRGSGAKVFIAALFLAASLTVAPRLTHAEAGSVSNNASIITASATADKVAKEAADKAAATGSAEDVKAAADATTAATVAEGKAQTATAAIANGGGSATFGGNCSVNPLTWGDCIVKAVGQFVLTLANFLLGTAGLVLNWVVIKTVFQFGSLIGNSPGMLVAWGIMRDLGNMILLFGFIFMGLATILDLHSFPTKKAIPRLLIFAILMNFSLFAAEGLIDISNGLSSVIYSEANTDPCVTIGASSASQSGLKDEDCAANYGIAGHIMQSTGLSTLFSTNGGFFDNAVTYIMLALFATIGAIVLFAASIMLVVRVVTLSFLMVLSPIGFAGMAIPPLQKMANQWWSKLLGEAFFAPVLFLFIFMSLKITDSFAGGSDRSLAAAIAKPNASVMGIVMVFVIVIGFMIASLITAKSIGSSGATFAIAKSKGMVLGSMGWAGGMAGRATVGKGSKFAQKKYEAWLGNGHGGVRGALVGTKLDDVIKGTLVAGQNAKFGSGKSLKEDQDHHKARHEEVEKAARNANIQRDLTNALAAPANTTAEKDARDDKIAEVLERMSAKELEELEAMKKAGADLDTLARNLSPEKFSALVKDGGALSEQKKKDLKDARFRDVRTQQGIIADPTKTTAEKDAARKAIKDRVKKYSVKDLENGPSDLLTDNDVAMNLTNSQRDDLLKNGKITPGAVRKVKEFDPVEQVNKVFRTPGLGAAAARGHVISKKLNPTQVARLDVDFLKTVSAATVLSAKMLQAIQKKNELDDADVATIKANVMSAGTRDAQDYVSANPAGRAYWS